ncbi:MAG: NADP-dependent malic enzyme, partial [Candidatus Pacebacteria bacterium]|nr:NADP-dependent malic enzyme [Candidatus Paceibacterota bacterium]
MDDIYAQSVELHRKNRGKLATKSKVPLENRADLSVAYTPGVAEVCRLIAKDTTASFTHTLRGNCVAVVTDGSAILGLGNLGPEAAMPVMEGKAVLFKAFADIDAFPICLATQDVEEIIKTVKNIAPSFGGINLEDIAAPRCFEIEDRLKAELSIPVMHDDQHGTATVVLAALINALKVRGSDKAAVYVVVSGSGAAGSAVVKMLVEYGVGDIVVCDSIGAVHAGRTDLNASKKELAMMTNKKGVTGSLAEVMKGADVFIGVSAPNIVTGDMVKGMAPRPIVFGLANPVPEIMPDVAKEAGSFVVATGRSDFPNQINNVLAFPGIFRGALDNKVRQITDTMLVKAAIALAGLVPAPTQEMILPDPFDAAVVPAVANA